MLENWLWLKSATGYLWQDADNGRLCRMVPGNSMAVPEWLSEEALQTAEERRKAKGKGERGRYTQLNADFQSKDR